MNSTDAGSISRRQFTAGMTAGIAAAGVAGPIFAQAGMPVRPIPGTNETLPIVGLGSTRPVAAIAELGSDRVEAIVRALAQYGGRMIDTWPRAAQADAAFGAIISKPDLRDELFVSINFMDTAGYAGIDQFERLLNDYGRVQIDLLNVGNLVGLDELWPRLRAARESGQARYIGVTVAQTELYGSLEQFLRTESPDFVMVNYSVTERDVEQRLLPLLEDKGIAVLVSRPFMNGAYFERLENVPLPSWTAEFDCESWAQFSLLYILANTSVTCVLTETTNPDHMAENAQTAFKPFPDAATLRRMREFIDQA
jgi:diketogulonate reductase-like aldo/keto reductase